MNFKNVIVLVSLIWTALGSGACGSSAPSAPTQLPGTTTPTSIGNGATINGSITGPGAIVEVKGSTHTDGTVRATEVKFEDKDDDTNDDDDREDKNKVELEGLVTAGNCSSFTVKNIVVTTNAITAFKNGRCDEIAIGARVHVRATPTGATTALAMLVNIQRDADDNGKSGDRDDNDGDNRSGNSGSNKGKGKD